MPVGGRVAGKVGYSSNYGNGKLISSMDIPKLTEM